MMSHACTPTSRGCMYCQQRAEAAAKALAAVLKHGGMGVSAAVADAFVAGGRSPHQLQPTCFMRQCCGLLLLFVVGAAHDVSASPIMECVHFCIVVLLVAPLLALSPHSPGCMSSRAMHMPCAMAHMRCKHPTHSKLERDLQGLSQPSWPLYSTN